MIDALTELTMTYIRSMGHESGQGTAQGGDTSRVAFMFASHGPIIHLYI